MSAGGKRWLTGCAVGCLGLLVVLGVLAVIGGRMAGRAVEGFVEAESGRQELAERHGPPEAFIPPGPARLPAERLDLFLKVRSGLAPDASRLQVALAAFRPGEIDADTGALSRVWQVMRGLGDVLQGIGGYLEARNRALLQAGMGQGEYLFYYALGYYAFLGHRPGDMPDLAGEGGKARVRLFEQEDRSYSPDKARRRYRFYALSWLRNQAAGPQADDSGEALRQRIAGLESDPSAIAWREGMPEAWASALERRRQRLESSWTATSNLFEWPRRPGESDAPGLRLEID